MGAPAAARSLPPLLDLGLLRTLPGYLNGLVVGALYVTGFPGLLLVPSVHLQGALDLTPLAGGLLLVPFALGSAASAPVAGRVAPTAGRPFTVVALVVMMSGVALLTVLVATHGARGLAPVLVPILLPTGLVGGAVPQHHPQVGRRPARPGWAVGREQVQIGQRIGAAVLMTVYQAVLGAAGEGPAGRTALVTALVRLAFALGMAVGSPRSVGSEPGSVSPSSRPESARRRTGVAGRRR